MNSVFGSTPLQPFQSPKVCKEMTLKHVRCFREWLKAHPVLCCLSEGPWWFGIFWKSSSTQEVCDLLAGQARALIGVFDSGGPRWRSGLPQPPGVNATNVDRCSLGVSGSVLGPKVLQMKQSPASGLCCLKQASHVCVPGPCFMPFLCS